MVTLGSAMVVSLILIVLYKKSKKQQLSVAPGDIDRERPIDMFVNMVSVDSQTEWPEQDRQ